MSNRAIRLNDTIEAYLRRVSVRETDVQRRLRAETASLEHAGMQIGPEQRRLRCELAFVAQGITRGVLTAVPHGG